MKNGRRHVWSNVMAVAYKEGMALRHDKPLIATLLIQPMSFLIILGIAVSFTPRNVPWAVLDRSDSAVARRLVREVEASGYFLSATPVGSYEEGRALLQRGQALAFLVIDRDFARGDFDRDFARRGDLEGACPWAGDGWGLADGAPVGAGGNMLRDAGGDMLADMYDPAAPKAKKVKTIAANPSTKGKAAS